MDREELAACVQELWDELVRRAWKVIRTVTRNYADAEDVVQDAYCKAQSKLDTVEDPAKLRGWLISIVTNEARMFRRTRLRRRDFGLVMPLDAAVGYEGRPEADPEDALASTNPLYSLAALIDRATPARRGLAVSWLLAGGDRGDMARLQGTTRRSVDAAVPKLHAWAARQPPEVFRDEAHPMGRTRPVLEAALAACPRLASVYERERFEVERRLIEDLVGRLGFPEFSVRLALLLHNAECPTDNPGRPGDLGLWLVHRSAIMDALNWSRLGGNRTPRDGRFAAAALAISWRKIRSVPPGNGLQDLALSRFRRWLLRGLIHFLICGHAGEREVRPLLTAA